MDSTYHKHLVQYSFLLYGKLSERAVCGEFCVLIGYPSRQDVYIIDQKRGQDGWILAEFSFCVFMDWDEVEVHKNLKRERGQYPAILTELAWSIKDLLNGINSTEKNDRRTCLFLSTVKETS